MHISWCLDVKHVRVDVRALSEHAYETELQYMERTINFMILCVSYLLHCFHFFSISYFILSIGDVLSINSADMYNVQTS